LEPEIPDMLDDIFDTFDDRPDDRLDDGSGGGIGAAIATAIWGRACKRLSPQPGKVQVKGQKNVRSLGNR
jgi:hypothetical protein